MGLVKYYTEVIGILSDATTFLRRRSLYNLAVGALQTFTAQTERRLAHLRELTQWVDTEAAVTASDAHEAVLIAQHQELLGKIESLRIEMILARPKGFKSIPYLQNGSFYGREDVLSALTAVLRPEETPKGIRSCVLYGIGGGGKTQTAVEFAYQNIHNYGAVFWVTAETEQKLAMSFASLARAISVVDETVQQQDQIREVFKRWLVDNSEKEPGHSVKWLMIFDNVDDHRILRPYWPSGSNGSVIVTTRDVKLARQYSKPPGRIELGPFSDSEAQKFLLSIIQIGNPEQLLPQQRLEKDLPSAATITHALGNLPLAIHLVGSYIATNGRSLLSFLEDNPTFEIDFIFDDELRLMSEQDYERSIETTWTLQLASMTPQTQLLMDLIALFDADGAPTILFQAHWQSGQAVDEQGLVLPDGYTTAKLQDKTCLGKSVSKLQLESLVSASPGNKSVSCNRLVQRAVIKAMSNSRKQRVFNLAMLLLHAAFPTQEDGKPLHEQWRECELYCRHTSSLLDKYQWLKDELQYPIVLCEVVTRCSWFLLEQGRFKASTAMAQQASVICEHAIRSSKHPGFSTHYMLYLQTHLYNVLAGIQLQQLAPDYGLALFTKIRDIRAHNQRSGDTEDAKWLNFAEQNRALALMAQGRAEEAFAMYQSREDIETNRDFNLTNTSICLYLLKRYDEAITYALKAIDVTRDMRGENSPSAAYPLFYLGSIYSQQGNLDEAFKALSKCLAIRQEKLPRHLDTGLTLHKLGMVVRQRGDLDSSIRIFVEALEIIQSSEYHPGAACRTAFALAETYSQHGSYGHVVPLLHARGITLRSQIVDWETLGLGESSEEYDRFIGVQHR